MPAVNLNLYDKFRQNNFNGVGAIDFDADTIKAAVFKVGYTPDQNLHDFYDDLVPGTNEVVGTGYTARGNTCANGTISLNGAGLVTVDLDDPATWAQNGAGFSDGRRVVFYKDTGVDATSPLIAYTDDFGTNRGNVDGDFSVLINAGGLFTSAR